jgi:hypothetical protein
MLHWRRLGETRLSRPGPSERPARLLIEVDEATDPAELVGLVRRLQAPVVARRNDCSDRRNLGARVIASVLLLPPRAKTRPARRHNWSWPMRTNRPVFGRGVERGFVVHKPRLRVDIALAPILPAAGPKWDGVRLILDAGVDPAEALRRRMLQGTMGRRSVRRRCPSCSPR